MSTPGVPDPATSPAPVDPLVSMRLGEFVIEERIGAGGMGVVYRAVHPVIGKQAAVKVLRAELMSPEQEQRLLVEAKAVNAIRHPGILDIFNCGALPDGRPYVVMELLQGRSLEDVLRVQGRLGVGMTVWVLDQLLSALAAAHRAGVVHRDLKPENVFLVEVPDTAPSLKLVDFGIAQVTQAAEEPPPSGAKRPSGVKRPMTGTPECMSPEQIRGGPVGPAADLYAVGILAFQMLTGARPFQGEHMQVMFAQVEQPPPPPSTRAEGIGPGLDALVLQLLEKDPARRPASAQVVRQQLQQLARELSLEGPEGSILAFTPPTFAVPPPPAVSQPMRWGRAPIAMAAVVALGLLGMGTGVMTWAQEAEPDAPAAVKAASDAVPETLHPVGPLDTWETVLIRSRAPAVLRPAGGPDAALDPTQ
ncbi:serine/threonine-protein kinase [Corallococcus sp. CA053C]|uniref:serine/threonine-protein kinase n=1 Tax=Corallococcus sp. CA053C TaxID=2316732 RepID=UPI001F174A7E|nr:serine/threonine-protein kinase [Corallococcus sp. CA053C]